MKSAEEWAIQLLSQYEPLENNVQSYTESVKQIQLDACKQGMTEASEIVARNWNGQKSNYCQLIETARDNKTSV